MKYLKIATILLASLQSFSAHAELPLTLSSEDRDAITRVAVAEAANQGESGLSGVVWTIINRYKNGSFGSSITDIVNSKNQFEPVTKVGKWNALPKPSKEELVRANTIINLILSGHFPDPTKGALYFQNPTIVKAREEEGTVSKGLTNFGGAKPTITIKDQAFYTEYKTAKSSPPIEEIVPPAKAWDVFNHSAYKTNSPELRVWK